MKKFSYATLFFIWILYMSAFALLGIEWKTKYVIDHFDENDYSKRIYSILTAHPELQKFRNGAPYYMKKLEADDLVDNSNITGDLTNFYVVGFPDIALIYNLNEDKIRE